MSRVPPNATPGTGEQFYIEACEKPEDHPRLSDEIDEAVERGEYYDEARLERTQFRSDGRTWQCGGEYWDSEINDLVVLEEVVRRSSWCNTCDAEEAPLYLVMRPEGKHTTCTVPLNRPDSDPLERFSPRYNVPFQVK